MKQTYDSPPLIFQPTEPETLYDFLEEARQMEILQTWEAAQIWDECQECPTMRVELSEKLRDAARKLQLWLMDASPTQH